MNKVEVQDELSMLKERLKAFWLHPRWLAKPAGASPATQPFLFAMAAVVGLACGIAATIFKELSSLVQILFIGYAPSFLEAAFLLPWYWRLLVPTIGGLFAGLVLHLLPREAKGHGVSEIMEAVMIRQGVLSFRAALVRSLSSLMSIGSGASIGREGPIVQISAALSSRGGRLFRASRENLTILVGCGVAAGLAAAYNVPIGASFFVMEIIIGNFAIEIFAPLVISSVASTLVYRGMFGNQPVYGTPQFALISNWELIPYVVLGLLSGAAAALFRSALHHSEQRFSQISIPFYVKTGLGGLLIGLIGLQWPHVWGNGFNTINTILTNQMAVELLLILFVMKIVATAITVGSGASGGVFTPTQFIGACLGGLIGFAAHSLFPGQTALPSAYALVGMGCLMAGTTYAPIMAIMMIFEMTLDYEIILPLMLSCILSSTVARRFYRDSIYTQKLRTKGIRYDVALEESALRSIRVRDLHRVDVPVILGNRRFKDVMHHLLRSRSNLLYVVESDKKLIGVIDIHDLKEFFNEQDLYSLVIARDIAGPVDPVYPEQSLVEVIEALYHTDGDQLPVVDNPQDQRFLGVISRRDIIGAYNREVLKKKMLMAKFVTREKEREGVDYVEIPAGYKIGRIKVPSDLADKTLGEVNFRARYHLQVLELVRPSTDGKSQRLMAEPSLKLKNGDSLIVIGADEDFENFQKLTTE